MSLDVKSHIILNGLLSKLFAKYLLVFTLFSDSTQLKLKAYKQLKTISKSKDKRFRKKSFVQEFKKIKQEIEEEIKQEKKFNKKHYKSLFNSITNPLQNDKISSRKFKFKNSKNSTIKQLSSKHHIQEELDTFNFQNKSSHHMNKSQIPTISKNKVIEKETLEKSQEIQKHFKVQENLKMLHEYIRKIRARPTEKSLKVVRQTQGGSKSNSNTRRQHNQTNRKSHSSKSRKRHQKCKF